MTPSGATTDPPQAHHGIDPFADAGALLEHPRVDEIHAAGPRHRLVDNDKLAVQAQVGTTDEAPEEAHWQRRPHLNAGCSKLLRLPALQPWPRAQGVHEYAASDTSFRRPNRGFEHIVRASAFVPDIERHGDARPGLVDVTGDGLQHLLRVGIQLDIVAANRRGAGDIATKLIQTGGGPGMARPVYVGEIGPLHVAAGLAENACERIDPVSAFRTDAAFSDEEVEKRAGEGQHGDQEQPREGHARRRPLHDDANADREHDQHVCQSGNGQRVVEVVQGV